MSHPKKIVILGHFGVGKTSLIRRFVTSQFSEDYLVTVGVHVKKKDIVIDGNIITLVIWDIEGNTSIEKARASYLLGTSGFLYVFDVSRPETYESLETEMKYLKETFPKVPVIVLGNKKDKFKEGISEEFFRTKRFDQCMFTSAKEDDNVETAFASITRKILSI